jgi:hypothetical protein
MTLTVLLIMQPNKGKEARCEELLTDLIKTIEAKEPDVRQYLVEKTDDYEKGFTTWIATMKYAFSLPKG